MVTDPYVWLAVGAFVISALGAVVSLWRFTRERRSSDFRQSADYIRAKGEVQRGNIEAAEQVIQFYARAMAEIEEQLQAVKAENRELRSIVAELRARGC